MVVKEINIPPIIPDNERFYLTSLQNMLNKVDNLCKLEVKKSLTGYQFRISPSTIAYSKPILKNIVDFHNKYNIIIDMSKSIKTSIIIFYKINFE